jgi:hypothetical protein
VSSASRGATKDTCMSYEEEDTCMSYEEEDTCMSCEEEDTCMSYEEEDTCMSYGIYTTTLLLQMPLNDKVNDKV